MALSKEKKDRLILVVICGSVVCLGIWYGWVQSRQVQLTMNRTNLQKAKNQLEQAHTWIKNAESIRKEADILSKSLAEIEDKMASPADPFAWSYQLMEKIRAGHALSVPVITRPEKKEGDRKKDVGLMADFPYNAVTFTLSGNATYHDFGGFIADFENELPYFRLQGINLSGSADAASGEDSNAPAERLSFKVDVVALLKPTQ